MPNQVLIDYVKRRLDIYYYAGYGCLYPLYLIGLLSSLIGFGVGYRVIDTCAFFHDLPLGVVNAKTVQMDYAEADIKNSRRELVVSASDTSVFSKNNVISNKHSSINATKMFPSSEDAVLTTSNKMSERSATPSVSSSSEVAISHDPFGGDYHVVKDAARALRHGVKSYISSSNVAKTILQNAGDRGDDDVNDNMLEREFHKRNLEDHYNYIEELSKTRPSTNNKINARRNINGPRSSTNTDYSFFHRADDFSGSAKDLEILDDPRSLYAVEDVTVNGALVRENNYYIEECFRLKDDLSFINLKNSWLELLEYEKCESEVGLMFGSTQYTTDNVYRPMHTRTGVQLQNLRTAYATTDQQCHSILEWVDLPTLIPNDHDAEKLIDYTAFDDFANMPVRYVYLNEKIATMPRSIEGGGTITVPPDCGSYTPGVARTFDSTRLNTECATLKDQYELYQRHLKFDMSSVPAQLTLALQKILTDWHTY